MTGEVAPVTRPYRMGKRREDVDETRRRIVEAAVELHGTVGPANTTFSGVAARAGVQRSTLYRHFPDEATLLGACTSHWFARHPWPRPDEWRDEPGGEARLARGLRELYRYYDDNDQMMSNSFRDLEVMPAFVGESLRAQLDNMHAVLIEPWQGTDDYRLHIAVRHALDLRSYHSLNSSGLGPEQASELMTAMVVSLAS